MDEAPRLSVVMPVYNAAGVVGQAIESILNQTFTNFEFLILDDGSTDATGTILAEYSRRDARIGILEREHAGVSEAANALCTAATGQYIARIDADNVSLPARLERQFAFLEKRPDVGAVGCRVRLVYDDRSSYVWEPPATPNTIRWAMMFNCPLMQGASMMRRSLFERAGPCCFPFDEDYDFWIRAAAVSQLANLDEVLSINRKFASSLSRRNEAVIREMSAGFQQALMGELLGHEVDIATVRILQASWDGLDPGPAADFAAAAPLLRELYERFVRSTPLSHSERAEIALNVNRRLVGLALSARRASPRAAAKILWETRRYTISLFSLRSLARIVKTATRVALDSSASNPPRTPGDESRAAPAER